MQDFRSVVTALWARLGIGEPRFNEPGRVQLRIDGISLELTDNGRGLLVVEGSAGAFAADPAGRARQTQRVLQTNLGFVPAGSAGVYLKARPNGEKLLTGRATYDYRQTNLDYLVKIIEDVLQVVEYYGSEFKSAVLATTQRSARAVPDPIGAEVIFRP